MATRGMGRTSHLNGLTKPMREEKEGEKKRERGRRREKLHLLSRFPGDRTVGSHRCKSKVGPRSKSYAWVPESGSFDKHQEVGDFPTWFIPSLKDI